MLQVNERQEYGNVSVITSSLFGGITLSNRRMVAERTEVELDDTQTRRLLGLLLTCYGGHELGVILSEALDPYFEGEAETDMKLKGAQARIGDYQVDVCPLKNGFVGIDFTDRANGNFEFSVDLTHSDVADILRHVMRSK